MFVGDSWKDRIEKLLDDDLLGSPKGSSGAIECLVDCPSYSCFAGGGGDAGKEEEEVLFCVCWMSSCGLSFSWTILRVE